MFTSEQLAFLRQRRLAVLATVGPEGEPHAVPMWYALDGDDIMMVTARNSQKHLNLERDKRATVVVDHRVRPYFALMVDCAAEFLDGEVDLARSKIAARYLDEPELSTYLDSRKGRDSVLVRLHPQSVVVYGDSQPSA